MDSLSSQLQTIILTVELLKTRDYNLTLEIKEYVNTNIPMDKNDFTKTTKTIPNSRKFWYLQSKPH